MIVQAKFIECVCIVYYFKNDFCVNEIIVQTYDPNRSLMRDAFMNFVINRQ